LQKIGFVYSVDSYAAFTEIVITDCLLIRCIPNFVKEGH